jgi:hypothetical protein
MSAKPARKLRRDLWRLRSWLTLNEAAQYLSLIVESEVTPPELLGLAL